MLNQTNFPEIHTCAELIEFIHAIGFLPLLDSSVPGFSAEEIVDPECRYDPNLPWEDNWPLWNWKGQAVTDGNCVYGKFFDKKAGFIAHEWWADFCNYRRSKYPRPHIDSIERTILEVLSLNGSMPTRELRKACGFDGKGMRSRFDGYVTRLQMATWIVTEDFVYPHDKHNKQYGWGWSLLNLPENLYGKESCSKDCSAEESYQKIWNHFRQLLPYASDKQLAKLIG